MKHFRHHPFESGQRTRVFTTTHSLDSIGGLGQYHKEIKGVKGEKNWEKSEKKWSLLTNDTIVYLKKINRR